MGYRIGEKPPHHAQLRFVMQAQLVVVGSHFEFER
jgi:hypothetical protein